MQEVDKLQGKVRQSLKEMKIFLNGMGTVAANAVKELNNLKLKSNTILESKVLQAIPIHQSSPKSERFLKDIRLVAILF